MPLFPALIRAASSLNIEVFYSGILVSSLSLIFALFFLQKLLLLDFKKEEVNKSILLLLLFPTAFFFAAIYSEALFLLLSVLTLYFARKRNWFYSALFIMLAAVTRLSGLLLLLPVLYEYFVLEIGTIKKIKLSKKFVVNHKQLLWFLVTPFLLLGYTYFNFVTWGDPLYFVNAHAALGNSRETTSLVFPLITIYRYFKILFTVSPNQFEYWIALLEFVSLGFISYGVYLVWKFKFRISYLIYSFAMVILPLLSGTLTGFPRYILPVFPVFVAVSLMLGKHKVLRTIFIIISVLLQGLLFGLFIRRYFVA
jgi:hypothetical protein